MATDARINITAVDKTRAAFRSIQNSLSSVTGAIFSVQGAVAGLAGAAGFGALVRASLRTGDELGKTADKLGVTTEALAGLRHAAEQTAGVTGRTLDTALQRMTRRVSEAALGTGTAVKALDELGLSAQQLNSLAPDQQFKAIADAMQGVANQGDRVRLSMRLFDTEGVALVNTLKEGSEALDSYADEAQRLGIALSRVDSRRIEMANDAIDRVGKATQGVANAITVALAPTLTVLANQYTALSQDTDFWAETTGRAVNFVGRNLARLAEAGNIVAIAWNQIKIAISTAAEAIFGFLARFNDAFDFLAENQALRTEQFKMDIGERIAAMGTFTDEWETFQQRIIEAEQAAADSIQENQENVRESYQETGRSLGFILKRAAQQQKEFEQAVKQADREKLRSNIAYLGAAKNITNALFEDSKAAQIAGIIVDTSAAIMKTMASLPYPANIAAAAGVAAMGVRQLATARGASKGGGGGSVPQTGLAPGGTPGTVPDPTLADQGPGGPGRSINISLTGGLYSREDIRELIEGINREVGDGARLVTA